MRAIHGFRPLLAAGLALVLAACGGGGGGGSARVLAQAQSLRFEAAPTLTVDVSATVQALTSSGLSPRYSSLSPEVCRIDAATGLLTALRVGTCTVVADQAGNADWAVAPQATLSLAIAGKPQAVWFDTWVTPGSSGSGEGMSIMAGDSLNLRARADSGLPPQFASRPGSICRIDASSGQLSLLAAGTCEVQALQSGDAQWAATASEWMALPVSTRPQSLVLDTAPALDVGGSATLAGSATSSLALQWRSDTPWVCQVDATSGRVTAVAAGRCQVAAEQPGNAAWAAARPVAMDLTITRRSQSLTVLPPATLPAGGSAVLQVSASSALAPRVSSLTPQVCAVTATNGQAPLLATVQAHSAGRCDLQLEQAGDATWDAAPTQTLALLAPLRAQTLSLGAAPVLSVGGEAVLMASSSAGLAPRFVSQTPAVCAVDAGTGRVTALAAGSCQVAVQQAGNAVWATALSALQSFVIDQRTQAIRFDAAPALRAGGSASVSATASSGLPVRYASSTPAICRVASDSGAVQGLAEGECLLTADQAGDATFAAAAQAALSLSVAPDPTQTVRFGDAPSLTVMGSAQASASASSGLPVRYASLTPAVCAVDATSGLVQGLTLGTCTLGATQPGNDRWNAAAVVTQSFPVASMTQVLSFGAPASLTVGDSTAVTAAASSGLTVRFASLSASVCSVSPSGLVTGLSSGTCTVGAYQDGGGAWAAAVPVTLGLLVNQRQQTLAFSPAPSLTAIDTVTVGASASSGLPVRYASLTPAVCQVQATSGRLSGITAGTCRIMADQDGDTQYGPAPTASLTLSVSLAAQAIAFGSAPALTVGGSASVSALASSGLTVRYASLSTGICSIDAVSGLVSGLAAGTCSLSAAQPGNASWASADTASLSFIVQRQNQTLSFGSAPVLVSGSSGSARATSSAGLAVSYGSLTPAVCTVDSGNGLVTTLAVGTCTLQVTQAGNATYAAAAAVTQSFTVAVNPVQTLRFDAAPALSLGATVTVRAVASSGLTPNYGSVTPNVCRVDASSGVVSALTLGDCLITADQAGSGAILPAAQVRLTLPVRQPAGVTAPGEPSGVTATLGNGMGAVLVNATGGSDGGHPISGYTAVSSPSGWRSSAATLPVTVSCATSCAGETFTLVATNGVGAGTPSAATPVLTRFNVLTTFHEPDTQPRDSVFTGSFTLNSSTGEVTLLSGDLTESMSGNAVGSAPYYDMTRVPLLHQLQSWYDASLGGRFVASFAKNTPRTFTTVAGGDGWSPRAGVDNGGVYAGFPARYATTVQNSSILVFVPDNPFAPLTAAQIARLAYADCAPGGMMGAVCMTATSVAGYGAVGTMSGYPVSQVITRP